MDFSGIGLGEVNDNKIHHNSIHDIRFGIYIFKSNRCKVHRNNIYNNTIGMRVENCIVDAKNNWWGSEDGPSGEGPGSGDSIEFFGDGSVSFDPWLKKPAITRQFKILCLLACIRVRLRSLIG